MEYDGLKLQIESKKKQLKIKIKEWPMLEDANALHVNELAQLIHIEYALLLRYLSLSFPKIHFENIN